MTYSDPGVYCGSIVTFYLYLVLGQNEEAARLAKEFSKGDHNAEKEYISGAEILKEKPFNNEYTKDEIIGVIQLYIPFTRRFNPDFTELDPFRKIFQGNIFSKKINNNLNDSITQIEIFFIRCLTGTADPKWFNK